MCLQVDYDVRRPCESATSKSICHEPQRILADQKHHTGSQRRFRSSAVKECIHEVLKEELASVQYNPEEIPSLTKSLSETIRNKLKEKGYHRYKIVVQVVIGEQRGEGVNMAARCFWDADTDNYAQDVFMNDTLFCAVVAFGCFFY
ncbi:dynein light chain Tctex-type protein 2B isoform X1 [Rhineura floridana]|uniref:dynein light chain Tctex-type protein 2B isoform X1 n=1 Tax=Rhineura floridana TaxID=261503 RepID=UPI002AC81159|nr:dynein light chain Tctex-type protein 2B isoform X1 [Rhineura floridana]